MGVADSGMFSSSEFMLCQVKEAVAHDVVFAFGGIVAHEELKHKQFTLSSNWPTRVAKIKAQQAQITDAKTIFKFTPEILFSKGRFAMAGDKMTMELSEGKVRYHFQQGSYGSFALLTGAGTVYKDENGFKAELIRIYINPLRPAGDTAKVDSTKALEDK